MTFNRFKIVIPPDVVTAFEEGRLSVAFYAGRTMGPVFVTRERDRVYPIDVLRFRRIGEDKPFREHPCPNHKVTEHLRNFLFMPGE